MNASPAQILTLENYKAHLQSVKAELASVIQDLADVLQKKDAAENEHAATKSDLESLQRLRDSFQSANSAISSIIGEKTQKSTDLDKAIASKKAEFDKEEDNRKKAAQDFITACAILSEHKSKMESEAASAEAHATLAKDILQYTRGELTKVNEEIRTNRETRDNESEIYATECTKRNADRSAHELVIANLQDQHLKAQQDAGETDRILAERERNIKNSETNIAIIQNRLTHIWAEKFPGMSVPRL